MIICADIYDAVKAEFIKRGAHVLGPIDAAKAATKIHVNGRLNVDIVGQSVEKLSKILDVPVPRNSRVIIGEVSKARARRPPPRLRSRSRPHARCAPNSVRRSPRPARP